jgi:peroxidase
MNGLVSEPAARFDTSMNDHLQNHLFEVTLSDGSVQAVDLFATNVQRGRDHGLPSYAEVRERCGDASRLSRFDQLAESMPADAVARLERLYETVRDVDLFVGGLAERPLAGAAVGPTFACLIARQFSDLKRGDRFYYENSARVWTGAFSAAQLDEIKRVTLSQLLCSNFDMRHVQANAFMLPDQVKYTFTFSNSCFFR